MRVSHLLLSMALLLAAAVPGAAQTWPERVHVSINGAFQPTSNDFSHRFEFEENLETGSTDTDYQVQGAFVFDAGVGYRVWKNLGVGAAVSVFSRKDAAATRSNFPHPFFFERPREVTGDATDVTRKETVAHIQVMYLVRAGDSFRIVLSGGPSFFNVEQDLVEDVTISEAFPFDEVTFSSARKRREKASAPAFNVGADVMWMFKPNVGVGGIVRFARASVDLDAPGGRTISVDAGGFYAGGGVRFLF